MYRSRLTRESRYRNPSNLHVIPTASAVNKAQNAVNKAQNVVNKVQNVVNKAVQQVPTLTMPQIVPSVIPVLVPPSNVIIPPADFFGSTINNYGYLPDNYNKKRRKRGKRKRKPFGNKTVSGESDYKWFNPTTSEETNTVTDVADVPVKQETEKVVVPEVPTPAEEDFEEVEVASSEGEAKRVPVGFRKTQLHYLNYKQKSFFKPKFYNFSPQRIVVNCLNVEDDVSVDCDVVSEAEYDECEIDNLDPCDAFEKFGKIIEIEDDEMTDEAEDETDHNINNEIDDSTDIETDETSHAVVNKVDKKPTCAVTDKVNKKSCAVANEVDEKTSCVVTNKVNDKSVENEVNKKSTDVNIVVEVGKGNLPNNKKVTASIIRTYKVSIEGSDDLKQEKSLIQDKLDSWESHLIGLQYLVEICSKNEPSVLKYYCVLCDEELDVQELPETYVINHVSGSNHVAKYLEKHFPSWYKIKENSSYDFVLFQKLCERINENLGYYYMCITSNDYYAENKSKLKEIIQNISHPSEIDFKIEKDIFEKSVDSDLSKSIHIIMEDVMKKTIPKDEITTGAEDKENLESKLTNKNTKKESAPKPKYKGNNSISAYLRLNFAATNKLKLPSNKGKNNKTKVDTGQIVESVKSKSEEVKENVKSHEQQIASNISEQIVKNVKSKSNQSAKSPKHKNVEKPESKKVIETITLEDDESDDNAELKNEQLNTKQPGNEAQGLKISKDNSAPVKSHEVTSNVVTTAANQRVIKSKEKILLKTTTIHSKHCRKRILDNGMARLRLAAKKVTPKARLITEVSNNSNVKCKPVIAKVSNAATKKIISKKIKPELKENKIAINIASLKKKPSYQVTSVQQAPTVESKSSVTALKSSHQKSVQKKSTDNSSNRDAVNTASTDSSRWIPMRATSPILTSDISLFLKKIAGPPENPVKKRRVSKSPVKRITSPLRLVTKSRSRRHSKSPHRKRNSKSPTRRKSRSPYRKASKSPNRRSRSPVRRRSRSPQRRRSRSPLRRRSRSPRRRSRSPLRHRSRSPLRRNSRSPGRSRSPLRRYSRSASRSPLRRLSRSPLRKRSRSPIRRRSRSRDRRHSRSPIKRRSRSPYKRHSRSPVQKFSNNSVSYRNLRQVNSSNISQSSSSREYYSPDEHYHRNAFNFPKHSNIHDSEIARSRDESKMLHLSRINKSDRYKSQTMSSASARGISDLDPVSDEDESIYFSDKHLHPEDTVSPSSKAMLSKLIQKFSVKNLPDNSSDPGLNNLLQFMETHRVELEEFIALKSSPKFEKTNTMKIDPNFQQQTLLLQQFLLANLASSIQESAPSVSNVQYAPTQPPFIPENPALRFGHPSANLPTPVNMPPVLPQPAPMQPRFFPPNVSVPPPQLFQQPQPIQDFSPKPKPTTEVMFKDLKATVSKLFGANENAMKQNIKPQIPSYVTNQLPDPEKWDLNHPNAPKFNVALSPKNVFTPAGKNANFSGIRENPGMGEQISSRNNNASGQYMSGSSNERSQIPNLPVPPPDAKVTFCDSPRSSSKANLFPVVNPNFNTPTRGGVNDVKVSLAQRLASVLVKIGMVDVPAPLLQEMLMKIGAFSSSPRQDISENEILSILKRLGYLS